MKKKIGTVLDQQLLTEAKVAAVKENKRLSQVIEEALIEYLQRRRHGQNIVAKTHGALGASPEVVQAILEEEGVFEG
jgi:metal-responsive CopG/Arc/MetJ family transcriptional regulator